MPHFITDAKIRAAAETMVVSGMAVGRILPNKNFPDGYGPMMLAAVEVTQSGD
jgi:hypothetical protein